MANPEHEKAFRNALVSGADHRDFSGLDLSGVLLSSARLHDADLSATDLTGADLTGGYFCGCNLTKARLNKSRITTADLRDADLTGADLTAADLSGSVLTGASFSGANLTRARLVKAHLGCVDFTGANLKQADLRGALGLTEQQLASAINADKAILDERMLQLLGRTADLVTARHGKPQKRQAKRDEVVLAFDSVKPSFGDVFMLCGEAHPKFPPSGRFRFHKLADLGFEQVDDYFALCVDGEPVIWLYLIAQGEAVVHHPGPYDALSLDLCDRKHRRLWSQCVARFQEALRHSK